MTKAANWESRQSLGGLALILKDPKKASVKSKRANQQHARPWVPAGHVPKAAEEPEPEEADAQDDDNRIARSNSQRQPSTSADGSHTSRPRQPPSQASSGTVQAQPAHAQPAVSSASTGPPRILGGGAQALQPATWAQSADKPAANAAPPIRQPAVAQHLPLSSRQPAVSIQASSGLPAMHTPASHACAVPGRPNNSTRASSAKPLPARRGPAAVHVSSQIVGLQNHGSFHVLGDKPVSAEDLYVTREKLLASGGAEFRAAGKGPAAMLPQQHYHRQQQLSVRAPRLNPPVANTNAVAPASHTARTRPVSGGGQPAAVNGAVPKFGGTPAAMAAAGMLLPPPPPSGHESMGAAFSVHDWQQGGQQLPRGNAIPPPPAAAGRAAGPGFPLEAESGQPLLLSPLRTSRSDSGQRGPGRAADPAQVSGSVPPGYAHESPSCDLSAGVSPAMWHIMGTAASPAVQQYLRVANRQQAQRMQLQQQHDVQQPQQVPVRQPPWQQQHMAGLRPHGSSLTTPINDGHGNGRLLPPSLHNATPSPGAISPPTGHHLLMSDWQPTAMPNGPAAGQSARTNHAALPMHIPSHSIPSEVLFPPATAAAAAHGATPPSPPADVPWQQLQQQPFAPMPDPFSSASGGSQKQGRSQGDADEQRAWQQAAGTAAHCGSCMQPAALHAAAFGSIDAAAAPAPVPTMLRAACGQQPSTSSSSAGPSAVGAASDGTSMASQQPLPHLQSAAEATSLPLALPSGPSQQQQPGDVEGAPQEEALPDSPSLEDHLHAQQSPESSTPPAGELHPQRQQLATPLSVASSCGSVQLKPLPAGGWHDDLTFCTPRELLMRRSEGGGSRPAAAAADGGPGSAGSRAASREPPVWGVHAAAGRQPNAGMRLPQHMQWQTPVWPPVAPVQMSGERLQGGLGSVPSEVTTSPPQALSAAGVAPPLEPTQQPGPVPMAAGLPSATGAAAGPAAESATAPGADAGMCSASHSSPPQLPSSALLNKPLEPLGPQEQQCGAAPAATRPRSALLVLPLASSPSQLRDPIACDEHAMHAELGPGSTAQPLVLPPLGAASQSAGSGSDSDGSSSPALPGTPKAAPASPSFLLSKFPACEPYSPIPSDAWLESQLPAMQLLNHPAGTGPLSPSGAYGASHAPGSPGGSAAPHGGNSSSGSGVEESLEGSDAAAVEEFLSRSAGALESPCSGERMRRAELEEVQGLDGLVRETLLAEMLDAAADAPGPLAAMPPVAGPQQAPVLELRREPAQPPAQDAAAETEPPPPASHPWEAASQRRQFEGAEALEGAPHCCYDGGEGVAAGVPVADLEEQQQHQQQRRGSSHGGQLQSKHGRRQACAPGAAGCALASVQQLHSICNQDVDGHPPEQENEQQSCSSMGLNAVLQPQPNAVAAWQPPAPPPPALQLPPAHCEPAEDAAGNANQHRQGSEGGKQMLGPVDPAGALPIPETLDGATADALLAEEQPRSSTSQPARAAATTIGPQEEPTTTMQSGCRAGAHAVEGAQEQSAPGEVVEAEGHLSLVSVRSMTEAGASKVGSGPCLSTSTEHGTDDDATHRRTRLLRDGSEQPTLPGVHEIQRDAGRDSAAVAAASVPVAAVGAASRSPRTSESPAGSASKAHSRIPRRAQPALPTDDSLATQPHAAVPMRSPMNSILPGLVSRRRQALAAAVEAVVEEEVEPPRPGRLQLPRLQLVAPSPQAVAAARSSRARPADTTSLERHQQPQPEPQQQQPDAQQTVDKLLFGGQHPPVALNDAGGGGQQVEPRAAACPPVHVAQLAACLGKRLMQQREPACMSPSPVRRSSRDQLALPVMHASTSTGDSVGQPRLGGGRSRLPSFSSPSTAAHSRPSSPPPSTPPPGLVPQPQQLCAPECAGSGGGLIGSPMHPLPSLLYDPSCSPDSAGFDQFSREAGVVAEALTTPVTVTGGAPPLPRSPGDVASAGGVPATSAAAPATCAVRLSFDDLLPRELLAGVGPQVADAIAGDGDEAQQDGGEGPAVHADAAAHASLQELRQQAPGACSPADPLQPAVPAACAAEGNKAPAFLTSSRQALPRSSSDSSGGNLRTHDAPASPTPQCELRCEAPLLRTGASLVPASQPETPACRRHAAELAGDNDDRPPEGAAAVQVPTGALLLDMSPPRAAGTDGSDLLSYGSFPSSATAADSVVQRSPLFYDMSPPRTVGPPGAGVAGAFQPGSPDEQQPGMEAVDAAPGAAPAPADAASPEHDVLQPLALGLGLGLGPDEDWEEEEGLDAGLDIGAHASPAAALFEMSQQKSHSQGASASSGDCSSASAAAIAGGESASRAADAMPQLQPGVVGAPATAATLPRTAHAAEALQAMAEHQQQLPVAPAPAMRSSVLGAGLGEDYSAQRPVRPSLTVKIPSAAPAHGTLPLQQHHQSSSPFSSWPGWQQGADALASPVPSYASPLMSPRFGLPLGAMSSLPSPAGLPPGVPLSPAPSGSFGWYGPSVQWQASGGHPLPAASAVASGSFITTMQVSSLPPGVQLTVSGPGGSSMSNGTAGGSRAGSATPVTDAAWVAHNKLMAKENYAAQLQAQWRSRKANIEKHLNRTPKPAAALHAVPNAGSMQLSRLPSPVHAPARPWDLAAVLTSKLEQVAHSRQEPQPALEMPSPSAAAAAVAAQWTQQAYGGYGVHAGAGAGTAAARGIPDAFASAADAPRGQLQGPMGGQLAGSSGGTTLSPYSVVDSLAGGMGEGCGAKPQAGSTPRSVSAPRLAADSADAHAAAHAQQLQKQVLLAPAQCSSPSRPARAAIPAARGVAPLMASSRGSLSFPLLQNAGSVTSPAALQGPHSPRAAVQTCSDSSSTSLGGSSGLGQEASYGSFDDKENGAAAGSAAATAPHRLQQAAVTSGCANKATPGPPPQQQDRVNRQRVFGGVDGFGASAASKEASQQQQEQQQLASPALQGSSPTHSPGSSGSYGSVASMSATYGISARRGSVAAAAFTGAPQPLPHGEPAGDGTTTHQEPVTGAASTSGASSGTGDSGSSACSQQQEQRPRCSGAPAEWPGDDDDNVLLLSVEPAATATAGVETGIAAGSPAAFMQIPCASLAGVQSPPPTATSAAGQHPVERRLSFDTPAPSHSAARCASPSFAARSAASEGGAPVSGELLGSAHSKFSFNRPASLQQPSPVAEPRCTANDESREPTPRLFGGWCSSPALPVWHTHVANGAAEGGMVRSSSGARGGDSGSNADTAMQRPLHLRAGVWGALGGCTQGTDAEPTKTGIDGGSCHVAHAREEPAALGPAQSNGEACIANWRGLDCRREGDDCGDAGDQILDQDLGLQDADGDSLDLCVPEGTTLEEVLAVGEKLVSTAKAFWASAREHRQSVLGERSPPSSSGSVELQLQQPREALDDRRSRRGDAAAARATPFVSLRELTFLARTPMPGAPSTPGVELLQPACVLAGGSASHVGGVALLPLTLGSASGSICVARWPRAEVHDEAPGDDGPFTLTALRTPGGDEEGSTGSSNMPCLLHSTTPMCVRGGRGGGTSAAAAADPDAAASVACRQRVAPARTAAQQSLLEDLRATLQARKSMQVQAAHMPVSAQTSPMGAMTCISGSASSGSSGAHEDEERPAMVSTATSPIDLAGRWTPTVPHRAVAEPALAGRAPPPPPPPPPPRMGMLPPPPPPGVPAPPKGLKRVTPSKEQRLRLKQLHWDKLGVAKQGSIWDMIQSIPGGPTLEPAIMQELEVLFALAESTAGAAGQQPRRASAGAVAGAAGSAPGGGRAREVHLVEHSRAHNISIVLSGTRMGYDALAEAFLDLDSERLSLEQLCALIKAVPRPQELADLQAYLQGEHPSFPGQRDPARLACVERYFLAVSRVPWLEQRLSAMALIKGFDASAEQVRGLAVLLEGAVKDVWSSEGLKALLAHVLATGNALNQGTGRGSAVGFKLDVLPSLYNIKAGDKTMSLLQWLLLELLKERPDIAQLPAQLASVKAAANVQVSSLCGLVAELQAGLDMMAGQVEALQQVQAQQREHGATAAGDPQAAEAATLQMRASAAFLGRCEAFLAAACPEADTLAGLQRGVLDQLRQLAAYFQDEYDPKDPCRPFGLLRDFLAQVDKVLAAIQADRERAAQQAAQQRVAANLRRAGGAGARSGARPGLGGATSGVVNP